MPQKQKKLDMDTIQDPYELNLNVMELHISEKLYGEVDKGELSGCVKSIREELMDTIGMNIPLISIFINQDLEGLSCQFLLRKAKLFSKEFQVEDLKGFMGDIRENIMFHTRDRLADIITRQNVVDLLKSVKKEEPRLVKDLMENTSYMTIHNIFKMLLKDRIHLRNIFMILEGISDNAYYGMDVETIVENVRRSLGENITQSLMSPKEGLMYIMTLDSGTEMELIIRMQEVGDLVLDISEIKDLIQKTASAVIGQRVKDIEVNTLVVSPELRSALNEVSQKFELGVNVLSHQEMPNSTNFKMVASISLDLKTGKSYN